MTYVLGRALRIVYMYWLNTYFVPGMYLFVATVIPANTSKCPRLLVYYDDQGKR